MSDQPLAFPELDEEEQAAEALLPQTVSEELDVRTKRKEVAIALMQQLHVRGIRSNKDIKQNLAQVDPYYGTLTDKTIERYRAIIAERNRRKLEEGGQLKKTAEQIALEIGETLEEVNKEFWRMYHAKSNVSAMVKLQALKEIRDTMKDHLKIMQSLGLVYEAPVKTQQVDKDGNPVDPVMSVEKAVILQGFSEFMNTKYRDPLPTEKEMQSAKIPTNTAIGQNNEALQGA